MKRLFLFVKLNNRDAFMPEGVVQLRAFQFEGALLRNYRFRMFFIVFLMDAGGEERVRGSFPDRRKPCNGNVSSNVPC